MASLDKNRKQIADRITEFEKTTEKLHAMADKLHKKTEQLRLETIATRERSRVAGGRKQSIRVNETEGKSRKRKIS